MEELMGVSPLRVLVVDDDRVCRLTTAKQLEQSGYTVDSATNAFEAMKYLEENVWDVVVTDLRMPQMNGIEFVQRLRAGHPETDQIVITAHGTVDTAVEAMRLGVADFLTKPFPFDVLKARLERLTELRVVRSRLRFAEMQLRQTRASETLIGRAPSMQMVREKISLFAEQDLPVLVTGETGTGKEVVARAIHDAGPRRKEPFVAIACGAIPRELAESELFGHEKGSFTGASMRHLGALEQAGGGTVLLDDIDDLPLNIQVKLLRALQGYRLTRVGGNKEIPVAARIIATTKIRLGDVIEKGGFRDDLYYRLRALEIFLPPLRERREDILLLAIHFQSVCRQRGKGVCSLSEEAAEIFQSYPWPGNVRELCNAVESACVFSGGGCIEAAHLPEDIRRSRNGRLFSLNLGSRSHVNFAEASSEFERDLIDWAMKRADGNQGRAAEILGLPRTTLQSKLS